MAIVCGAFSKAFNVRCDLDRGSSYITYNLLNLPDTVQFQNGNQLIMEYDANGKKSSLQRIVLAEPIVVPQGIIADLRHKSYSSYHTNFIGNLEIEEPGPGNFAFTFNNPVGYVKMSDREGPNYELGGTPYPYMPYVFIIPY